MIFLAIAALAVSAYNAVAFYKAGSFKSKATKEVLLGAGIGWVANAPMGVVRLVAWLEILGALGSVIAPAGAYVTGLEWSKWIGVAAAVGLALTMVGAIILHQVRKETKYTWKINSKMLLLSVLAAALQALVVLPLF